jgi:hypothetical protein
MAAIVAGRRPGMRYSVGLFWEANANLNNARVAQLVEQRIRNAKVTSSIPVPGTKRTGAAEVIRQPLFALDVATCRHPRHDRCVLAPPRRGTPDWACAQLLQKKPI